MVTVSKQAGMDPAATTWIGIDLSSVLNRHHGYRLLQLMTISKPAPPLPISGLQKEDDKQTLLEGADQIQQTAIGVYEATTSRTSNCTHGREPDAEDEEDSARRSDESPA